MGKEIKDPLKPTKFSNDLKDLAIDMVTRSHHVRTNDFFDIPLFERDFEIWFSSKSNGEIIPVNIKDDYRFKYANDLLAAKRHEDDGARISIAWKDDDGEVYFGNPDFINDIRVLTLMQSRLQNNNKALFTKLSRVKTNIKRVKGN
jgi:hypothetical protein